MPELYFIGNGAMPTTAAMVKDTTHAVITTLLQVKMGSTLVTPRAKVVEWGISFDRSAAATPIACELFANTVAGTGTAHVAAGIVTLDPLAATPTDGFPFQLTTTTTCYNITTEGTPANVRMFDVQLVAPTNQFVKQWPLGREPSFKVAEYLRIRVTAAAAVNAYCFVVIEV